MTLESLPLPLFLNIHCQSLTIKNINLFLSYYPEEEQKFICSDQDEKGKTQKIYEKMLELELKDKSSGQNDLKSEENRVIWSDIDTLLNQF